MVQMSCESKKWAPSRIRGEKLRRYLTHVYRAAFRECDYFLGPHDGRIVSALLLARRDEHVSRTMLGDLGVKTIGEVSTNDA